MNGSAIFAGTWGGVFVSTNNGTSWNAVNSGLADSVIYCLAVRDSAIFAGTDSGVWRRTISQMGVLNSDPRRVVLNQSNFKLLFSSLNNPNVTIEFSLPHSDKVTLTVYNLSGHEIASLVNQNLGQGSHRITWNTRNFAAGCYTVRLRAGSNAYVKSIPIFR